MDFIQQNHFEVEDADNKRFWQKQGPGRLLTSSSDI